MAHIVIGELDGEKPLFRVELRDGSGKMMLSRRFREKHIAIGMAVAVCGELGLPIDVSVVPLREGEGNDDGGTC